MTSSMTSERLASWTAHAVVVLALLTWLTHRTFRARATA